MLDSDTSEPLTDFEFSVEWYDGKGHSDWYHPHVNHDGFFEINGDTIIPIGAEKVNRFFDLDLNKAFSDRICSAVDPFNQLALWLYPSAQNTNNTTGICDRLLIYNYATKKWSLAESNASFIFSQFVGAYTVELMDIISQNLENINITLDTDFWSGGQLLLGAIDNNYIPRT